jgi:hypothetical protein
MTRRAIPLIEIEPQLHILRCKAAMIIFTAATLAILTLAAIAAPERLRDAAQAEQMQ